MALSPLSADIILSQARSTLGQLELEGDPQPGSYLEFENRTYLVLERRNRYQLTSGKYRLRRIMLYVQEFHAPVDKSLLDGQWVIGDITCQYNARSELLRCTVNPSGPCDRCPHYQPKILR